MLCCCLQRKLMERNVAEEIAGKVVDSVAQSLEGQKLSSFTGVQECCGGIDILAVWKHVHV